jgi:hypothetical protein
VSSEEDSAWRLIAVLQSTVLLPPVLSVRLYRTAVGLHRADKDTEALSDEAVGCGVVRRLRKELLLGTFGGPGFEAELETPHGKGFVRFIVTQEGLDHADREDERIRRWQRAHWN